MFMNKSAVELLITGILCLGCFSIEAEPLFEIQIEKQSVFSDCAAISEEVSLEDALRKVEVAVREGCRQTLPLSSIERTEIESEECPSSGHTNRQVIIQHRPRYLGRVPAQPAYPRYGCGIVVHPQWRYWPGKTSFSR